MTCCKYIIVNRALYMYICVYIYTYTSIIWSSPLPESKKDSWVRGSRGIVVVQVGSLVRTWQNAWHHKQHGDYIVAHLWVGWFLENICVGLHGVASCVGNVTKQLESEQLPTLQQQFCFTKCQEPEWHYTIINNIPTLYNLYHTYKHVHVFACGTKS